MSETQETLKQLQDRVKNLQSSRDEIIGTLRVQESRREESYLRLKELGVENPEKLTPKELQALADQKREELTTAISTLNEQLAYGEKLITRYQELQQG